MPRLTEVSQASVKAKLRRRDVPKQAPERLDGEGSGVKPEFSFLLLLQQLYFRFILKCTTERVCCPIPACAEEHVIAVPACAEEHVIAVQSFGDERDIVPDCGEEQVIDVPERFPSPKERSPRKIPRRAVQGS